MLACSCYKINLIVSHAFSISYSRGGERLHMKRQFGGWNRMVWRLETHGTEAGNAWYGGRSMVVRSAKVAFRGCESGTPRVRKWHFEGAKVALRGCESGTSRVRKRHYEGAKVPLLELPPKLTQNQISFVRNFADELAKLLRLGKKKNKFFCFALDIS